MSDGDLRRRPLGILRGEELAGAEAEQTGVEDGGEALDSGVERLDDRVVVAARGGDLVLGVGKLALQLLEVLRRSELRVGLGDREQLSDRAGQGVARGGGRGWARG